MAKKELPCLSKFSDARLSESKVDEWHKHHILTEYTKELKSHDWFHAFADDHRTRKNGSAHMEEIRNAIGWINSNLDTADKKFAESQWKKHAPSQFKKNYPKGLKKFTNIPSWINKILKQKPLTYDGDVG